MQVNRKNRRGARRASVLAIAALALPLIGACGQGSLGDATPVTGAVPHASYAPEESSTHPDMTQHAIARAAANFHGCIGSMWPTASRRGISRASFERITRGLEPDLSIMELLDKQPEFTRAVWEYLETVVSERRVASGREMLTKHAAAFQAIERRFGADRYIVAAIWGVESNFGSSMGDRSVLRSTATLACIGRRQDYFRDEFVRALEIVDRGDIPAQEFNGSWAGAFGQTQFMPTAFQRHAVDFDGDRRRNIIGSVEDAIASTANMLKRNGWQTGRTWGYEVTLPRDFDFLLADRSTMKTLREWQALGVRGVNGEGLPHPDDRASLLLPAGANGPAFVVIGNFHVLMRYNPSESYALAVGHLADRMRGGGAFAQAWPRGETPLSRTERFELQERLAALGHYRGPADGKLGPETRAAVRNFQARAGLVPDGYASSAVLERARGLR